MDCLVDRRDDVPASQPTCEVKAMSPLQIILKLFHWLASPEQLPFDNENPFRHPDIAQMSARQLADLPMSRAAQKRIDAEDAPPLKRCA
ncbi:hypothetical protein LXM96_13815 [Rhizobium sp. TRM95001]|nr:hypothetical protein [Rhizobium halophilum]